MGFKRWYKTSDSTLAHWLRTLRRQARIARRRARALNFVGRYRFKKNLMLLNDVLATTDLAGKYWIWSGLLLGWAREGRILPHDWQDADFAFFSEDRESFLQAKKILIEAGFEFAIPWQSNAGVITEYSFVKDGAKFEFCEMYERGNTIRYFSYGPLANEWVEMICELPMHGLEKIEFLDRIWLKPDDHETNLTALYGNWREPDLGYHYAEDARGVIESYKRAWDS